MLPPSPPSPPSGPPMGMNFSRRKLTTPLPPLPAITLMMASSTNFISTPKFGSYHLKASRAKAGQGARGEQPERTLSVREDCESEAQRSHAERSSFKGV